MSPPSGENLSNSNFPWKLRMSHQKQTLFITHCHHNELLAEHRTTTARSSAAPCFSDLGMVRYVCGVSLSSEIQALFERETRHKHPAAYPCTRPTARKRDEHACVPKTTCFLLRCSLEWFHRLRRWSFSFRVTSFVVGIAHSLEELPEI
jgi:hypothetical protein